MLIAAASHIENEDKMTEHTDARANHFRQLMLIDGFKVKLRLD
jgi:hypothetical protein